MNTRESRLVLHCYGETIVSVWIGYTCHDIEKNARGYIWYSERIASVSSDNPGFSMVSYVRMVKNGKN